MSSLLDCLHVKWDSLLEEIFASSRDSTGSCQAVLMQTAEFASSSCLMEIYARCSEERTGFQNLKASKGGEGLQEKNSGLFQRSETWKPLLLTYILSNTQDRGTIKVKIQTTYLVRVAFLLATLFFSLQENMG